MADEFNKRIVSDKNKHWREGFFYRLPARVAHEAYTPALNEMDRLRAEVAILKEELRGEQVCPFCLDIFVKGGIS